MNADEKVLHKNRNVKGNFFAISHNISYEHMGICIVIQENSGICYISQAVSTGNSGCALSNFKGGHHGIRVLRPLHGYFHPDSCVCDSRPATSPQIIPLKFFGAPPGKDNFRSLRGRSGTNESIFFGRGAA